MLTPIRRIGASRSFLVPAVAAVAIVLTLAFMPKDESAYFYRINKGLEIFGQVYRETSQSYVDTIDPDAFLDTGIRAMLGTLDPYTVFQRGDASDVDMLTTGSYGGIGITVGMRDSMVTITDVIDGYSAQQKGVRIGDRLRSINGRDVLHGPVESLRDFTRGEAGTTVSISVTRDGVAAPLTFKLTRDNIKVRSLAFSRIMPEGIGYIRLDRFSATAGSEVRAAIVDLKRQGDLRGVVLDLRDNPGGLLEAAVDVTGQFVPSGSVVVTTRGRDSAENKIYRTHEAPAVQNVPVIVLVNENSASAAEIVAGAMQDLDAAVIMGTQSYGKGLVQTVRRLPFEASLKITTARYYTPSGRSIQKIDYTARRGDSSRASEAPATFHTAHGRIVEQHGGIRPDTVVTEGDRSGIVAQLRTASFFFKFASRYAAGMATLPEDFTVSDRLVADFVEFAMDDTRSGVPDSSSAALVRDLAAAARREGGNAELLEKIDALRGTVVRERQRLLDAHHEQIRQELYREIIARFRSQHDRKSALLAGDVQVNSAVGLLRGAHAPYNRLLGIH